MTSKPKESPFILIVDDDNSQLITLSDILKEEKLHPICCKNAKEALIAISNHDIQVAILDLRLPDDDGITLLKKLKKINPELKAIINTAYATLDSAVMAVNQEAFAFVKKMGDVRDLLSHVHRAFHAHLENYSKTLESEVTKRTNELVKANTKLKKEIIERKETQKALEESEIKFRSLFDEAENMIHIIDPDGNILDVNQAHTKKLGYSKKELISKNILDLIEPAYKEELKTAITRKKEKFELKNYECVMYSKKGKRIYVSINETPQLEKNKTVAYRGIITDITALKEAEDAVKISEAKWRSISEYSPDHITLIDLDGTIRFVNRPFPNLPDEQVIGKSIFGYTPESVHEEAKTCFQEVIKTGILGMYTTEYFKENGESDIFEVRVGPVFDSGKIVNLLCSSTNVSERRKAEKEKNALEMQLRQAQKMEALGTLAGGIAHDFNNILSVIMGYSELLMDTMDPESLEVKNLKAIFDAGSRAKELVEQILTFSRQKEQIVKPVKCELIIKETIKFLRASIPSTIKIRENIYSNCPLVLADPSQIHQIVMNLCTNAYHAIGEDDGEIRVDLETVIIPENGNTNLKKGTYLKLTISDTGEGMEPTIKDRIFDPFFTTKAVGKGTGLGLSVVHGAVHKLNGTITVISEKDSGSVFTVYLPAVEGTEVKEEHYVSLLPQGNERVLLIDDDKTVAGMVEQMLKSLGYKVVVKTDSQNALDSFKNNPNAFDIVLSDQVMPNLTGINLAEKLLEIRKDIPIIIMTGFSEKISAEQVYKMGIKGYLEKPVIKKNIAELVRNILDNKVNSLQKVQ
jgi:PAS domain S-box-containing protein